MRSFIGGSVALSIDASDLQQKVNYLRTVLNEKNARRVLERTLNEVGKRAKTPIAKAVTEEYSVTQAWVKKQILNPQFSAMGDISMKIPIRGHKGSIGGTFHVSATKRARKKGGRITAKIVKGSASTMPNVMQNQGGNPPFYAPNKGMVFTRRGPDRFPIVRVKGLAVPQMPLNRAEDKTREAILKLADERLAHNMNYMFGIKG